MDDSPFDTDPNLWNAPKPVSPPRIPTAGVVETARAWRMGLEPPPRVWTVFVAFGLFFTLLITASVLVVLGGMIGANGFDFQNFELTLDQLLILMAVSVMLTCGIAIGAALLSPIPFAIRLGLLKPKLNPLLWLIAPLTCYALSLGITMLYKSILDQFKIEDPFQIERLLDGQGLWKQVLAVILVSLGAGFGEELLFRGYMQTRLTQRLGFVGSLAIVSILFGIIHLNLVQGVFATLLGLFVGTIAHRSGSIWPAIWCHVVSNFCALIVTFNLPSMSVSNQMTVFTICIVLVGMGTFLTLKLT